MRTTICLTEQEKNLRQLLLDASEYIGGVDGCTKPELRFTGGWVRDKLLGLTSNDIDVGISSMTGFRFGTLMKRYLEEPSTRIKYSQEVLGGLAKIEANPEKSKHLETVTTKILGLDIDLVNLRKETYDEDSRNPTMDFGSPVDDALRRDATVNALFYNLSTCEVEDFTGKGLEDMEHQVIRTPLSPYQTFKDDPLRVLRCIRFASKLGYRIDVEAEQSMSDSSIKEALRAKISRERIGIEVEKMLKGPAPRTALSLIDRLGLYSTIFTDPTNTDLPSVSTMNWSTAYGQLYELTKAGTSNDLTTSALCSIKSMLLRNREETYLAWLLSTLVPWAGVPIIASRDPCAKVPPQVAVTVVRQGLKTENKVTKVVEGAFLHRTEISGCKDAPIGEELPATSYKKRRHGPLSRENLGMSIRRWGPHWRSSAIFAILVDLSNAEGTMARQVLIAGYASWLSNLQDLDLLEAYCLKPLVDGKQLQRALGVRPGQWMRRALDIAMEWQLRNPDDNNPENGVAEVLSRKRELGLA
ncbi:CCA tRNA nucleotidyltransferase, mitochondrial [Lignoscripta atroalba]|nr:CCA tRNA nucleotidyltransferase, mitochondrial [Lignoscripta atroalba]